MKSTPRSDAEARFEPPKNLVMIRHSNGYFKPEMPDFPVLVPRSDGSSTPGVIKDCMSRGDGVYMYEVHFDARGRSSFKLLTEEQLKEANPGLTVIRPLEPGEVSETTRGTRDRIDQLFSGDDRFME